MFDDVKKSVGFALEFIEAVSFDAGKTLASSDVGKAFFDAEKNLVNSDAVQAFARWLPENSYHKKLNEMAGQIMQRMDMDTADEDLLADVRRALCRHVRKDIGCVQHAKDYFQPLQEYIDNPRSIPVEVFSRIREVRREPTLITQEF